MKPVLALLIAASVLLPTAAAQTGPPEQKILTNQDIVMLAKAGFTEDFIVNAIQSGKSHFDTSPAGLAELAKEGLNEHVVRAMAGAGMATEGEAVPAPQPAPPPVPAAVPRSAPLAPPPTVSPAAAFAPYPEEMVIPGTEMRSRVQVVKPTRAGLAIAAQTPYYESTSLLFGLYRKRVAVGAVPRTDQIIAPGLGGGSNSRMMANFPTLVAPAGSAVRYVVIP